MSCGLQHHWSRTNTSGTNTQKEEYRRFLNGVHVVNRDGLHRLWQFMEEKAGAVEVTVQCSDGVRRSWATWDSLDKFDNPKNACIAQLTMKAGSFDNDVRLYVNWDVRGPTLVYIESRENELAGIRESLHGIIAGMRHGLLSILRSNWLATGSVLLVATAAMVFIAIKALNSSDSQDSVSEAQTTLITSAVLLVSTGVIAMGVVVLYLLFKDDLLRQTHFAIGQGERRYTNWRNLWGAIGGAVLTIVVGVGVPLVVLL